MDKLWRRAHAAKFSPAAVIASAAAIIAICGEARAADPTFEPVEHHRRGGLMVSAGLGEALGAASGYPNDARKFGQPAFFTDTGASGGIGASGALGVAFTDWLSFGLSGFGGATLGGGDRTTFGGGAFLVEAFPVYALGGHFRDLGASVAAGVGITTTVPRAGGQALIESGVASRFAFAVFYEGFRAGKVAMGPFLAADAMWSVSAVRPVGWLGWRASFYSKP